MRGLPAVLVLGMMFAGCVDPQEPAVEPGRVDGTLVDQFMQPYGNTSVEIVELGLRDNTTARGGFSFVGLAPGVYTVRSDPPLSEPAQQQVVIEPGGREVVILQARRPVPDPVYKAVLGRDAQMLAALPGQECRACAWTTRLSSPADEVVLRADWQGAADAPLVVELFDEDGSLVRRVEGAPPIWEPVSGDEFEGPHLTVRVHVSDDPMPRAQLQIQTSLDIYYGADRASQE